MKGGVFTAEARVTRLPLGVGEAIDALRGHSGLAVFSPRPGASPTYPHDETRVNCSNTHEPQRDPRS
jgi:hypothetical protein